MIMMDDDIVMEYNAAKSKSKQVQILADENCVSKKEMIRKLSELGCEVDKRMLPKEPVVHTGITNTDIREAFINVIADHIDTWFTDDNGRLFLMGAYLMMERLMREE